MGNPIERSRLSLASWITLGVLLSVNLLLFFRSSSNDPAAEISAQRGEAMVQTAAVPEPAAQKSAARTTAARTTAAQITAARSASELTLLRELDAPQLAAMAVKSQTPPPPRALPQELASPSTATLTCRSWGPFATAEALEPVRLQVEKVGESLEVREAEVESPPDFLVFIGSDNNLDNARRILQELESQSIDAYVIAGGAFIHSVSAGVFSSRARAEEQQQKLVDLGYSPQVEALGRVQTVRFLSARVPEDFDVDGLESESCREIASAR